MKIVSILSRAAALSIVVAVSGLAFNALALGCFAAAASVMVLLITSADYTRRPSYGTVLVAVGRAEAMPLAA